MGKNKRSKEKRRQQRQRKRQLKQRASRRRKKPSARRPRIEWLVGRFPAPMMIDGRAEGRSRYQPDCVLVLEAAERRHSGRGDAAS